MALVLASHSPRRRELMALLTPDFAVDEANVDEESITAATPCELAVTLARLKALDVAARRPGDVVIGCDTVVEANGVTLGKPHGEDDAKQMLNRLSGGRHHVHTGVCIVRPGRPQPCQFSATTHVDFAPVPPDAIAAYVQTSEPYDKAGGYGIQGWAARYVTRVEGCYYNVMGLPVAALYQKLRELDIPLT